MRTLYAVIGPSGSGKSTYVAYARQQLGYGEIVSTTTRLPRTGEVDGKDYHFVSVNEFQKIDMIEVDEYAGCFYGTAQKDLDDAYAKSQKAFMVITYEGAESFKQLFQQRQLDIEVITIFINTPIAELEQRMIKRGDDLQRIQERITNIKHRNEYANQTKTDYVFCVDPLLSLNEACEQFTNFMKKISG